MLGCGIRLLRFSAGRGLAAEASAANLRDELAAPSATHPLESLIAVGLSEAFISADGTSSLPADKSVQMAAEKN